MSISIFFRAKFHNIFFSTATLLAKQIYRYRVWIVDIAAIIWCGLISGPSVFYWVRAFSNFIMNFKRRIFAEIFLDLSI